MAVGTTQNLYSSTEAAVALGLTQSRIRQICGWSEGKIGKKYGRDWFLSDSDLELIRMKFPQKEKSENEG